MVNAILAKRVNHIVTKGDNPAWPKGSKSRGFSMSRRTLQEYRNNRVLPFILLGGKVLYPETGLREVLEANYRKPLE